MELAKGFGPLFGDWSIDGMQCRAEGRTCWRASRSVNGAKEYCSIWHIPVPTDEKAFSEIKSKGADEETLKAYTEQRMRAVNRELAIAERLRGCAKTLTYLESEPRPWDDGLGFDVLIRTELCESFEKRAEKKPLTRQETEELGRDISEALAAVAEQGIVHRGVSPDSVFVTNDGFKLGGFEFARVAGSDEDIRGDSSQKAYMAPEGFKGEGLTPASDVYALGMILYRIMNRGRMPFEPAAPAPRTQKDYETALFRRIAGSNMPAPMDADPAMARAILSACAYEPKDRLTASQLNAAFTAMGERSFTAPAVLDEPAPTPDKVMPEKPKKEKKKKARSGGEAQERAVPAPEESGEDEVKRSSKGVKAAIIVFAVIAALAVLGIVGMLVIKPAIDDYNAEKEAKAFKPHAPEIVQDAEDPDLYHVTIYAENGSAVIYETPDGRRREYQVYEDHRLTFDLRGSEFIPDEPMESTAYSVQPKYYTRNEQGELTPITDMGYIMLDIPMVPVTITSQDPLTTDDGKVTVKGVCEMPEAVLTIDGANVKTAADGSFSYDANYPANGEYEMAIEASRNKYCTFRQSVKVIVAIPEPSVIQMPWELGDNTYSQRVADPGDTVNVRGMVPPGAMLTARCDNEEVVINEINIYDDGAFNFGVTLPAIGDYELELTCVDASGAEAKRMIHVQRAPEWRSYVEGSWAMSYDALTRAGSHSYNIKGTVTKIIEHLDRYMVELTTSDGNTLILEYHHHYPTANPFELGREYKRIYGYPVGPDANGAPVVYVWFVIG